MNPKLIRAVKRREAVERIADRFIEAVIREEHGEYCVRSPNNPDWNGGCFSSKEKAEERLKEVEFFKRQAASARWIQRSDKRYEADVGFLTLKVWKNKASDTGWSWDVGGAILPHPGVAPKASVAEAQRAAIEYCQQELDALKQTLDALASSSQRVANRYLQAKLRVHDQVTLPKGHRVGMGHLKQDTLVTVESVHQGEEGEFYRVAWTDQKGRPRTTYIREEDIKGSKHQASVGDPTYPKGHRFGLKVPKGGSSCAKCRFLSKDGKHCASDYFQHWQKSLNVEDPSLIPEPSDSYCCDVFSV